MMWVRVSFLCLMALLLWTRAEAKVYQCEGPNGTTILTDQPKGKRGCAVVKTATPPLPGGYTPPADPTPSASPDPSLDVSPPSVSPMLSRPPHLGEPVPPASVSSEPSVPAASEAQHCSPRVNPLNPFAGPNCAPASSIGETKNP
jgi:hypothetical protein